MTYKVLLVKLLPQHYVNDFLDGNLYMNTVEYFSKIEMDDEARADRYEGIDRCLQVKEVSIANEAGEYIPIGGVISPILYRDHGQKGLNIFCMYAIPDSRGHCIDERNQGFGEIGVVVTDAEKFVERFRGAALTAGRHPMHGPIDYVDKQIYHGSMGAFRKFNNFAYQHEFRLAVDGGNGDPFVLSVGDIRDICMVGPSLALNNIISIIENEKESERSGVGS